MNGSKQIKLGAMMSYIVIFFNIVAGLLYTPWMVSKIGKADYGLYILVTSFLAYFVVDFGMFQAINKLISQYRAEKREDKVRNLIGLSIKIYLILDVFVCMALVVVYYFIDDIFIKLTPGELMKFKNIFLIASIMSILSFPFLFLRGVIMSYEYFIQQQFFELASKVSVIVLTVVLLLLNFGLYALVIVYGAIPVVMNILKAFFLYKKGIRANIRFWQWSVALSIFSLSGWLLLIVLAELFINNVSPSIIATFSGTEEIAVFAIGLTINGYVHTFANGINGLFLPKVSKMYFSKQHKQISDLTIRVGRIQFLIVGYIIGGVILLGQYFITAWMGESFHNSYYIAVLLILPGLIIYAQQVETTYLFVVNKIKYRSIMMVATAITSVFLSIILVPRYASVGAAIAISTANMIFLVLGMNIVLYKVMNYQIVPFFRMLLKFFLTYLLIATVYFFIEKSVIEYYVIEGYWKQFIIRGIVYSCIYSITMYLIMLDIHEKELINTFANKIVKHKIA